MPVQKLNKVIRDAIFHQTRAAVLTEQPHLTGNGIEFAWHGYRIIKTFAAASRTIVQAGTANWPRVPPYLDDVIDTHFTYT